MQKIELQSVKVKAKISLTADDWQLYSNVPGRNLTAKRLNRAVERKLAKGEIDTVHEALYPFSKWGAADSEGFWALSKILRDLGFDPEKAVRW